MTQQIGDYHIVGLIGTGGVACTYEAVHEPTQRKVALKTLKQEASLNETVVEAFRLEAKLAGELSHPNLVACLDMDVEANPPWIAFEHIEGASLGDVIKMNDFLDANWAMNLSMDIAYGLAAAHQKGILHRDIKPANILFAADGSVKLIDFGAASVSCKKSVDPLKNSFSGTPSYASPEQLKGDVLDGRSDLYSLGLVLYEMLTGKRLLHTEGSEEDEAMAIFRKQACLLGSIEKPSLLRPNIPAGLDDIILGLLAFRPNDRAFNTPLEFIAALDSVLAAKGWHYEHRDLERQAAHEELAEVAYWRGLSKLNENMFGDVVILFSSIFDHPPHVYSQYYGPLREKLTLLLQQQLFEHLSEDPDEEKLFEWSSALLGLVILADKLDAPDFALIAERRMLTLLEWLDNPIDRAALLARYLTLRPTSIAANLFSIRQMKRSQDFVRLVEATYADGWYEKVVQLLKNNRKLTKGLDRELAKNIAAELKEYSKSKSLFLTVTKQLKANNGPSARLPVCRRFTEDYPGSYIGWMELAKVCEINSLLDEACEAYEQAATLAFRRDRNKQTIAALKALLAISPENELAQKLLVERFYCEGSLPRHFTNWQTMMAKLLLECGFAKSAELTLSRLPQSQSEEWELTELHKIASSRDYKTVLSELNFHLGRLCLGSQLLEQGLEYFNLALEWASAPAELLNRLEKVPNIRQVFSPMKLLSLKQQMSAA